jgi:hypothetical protein
MLCRHQYQPNGNPNRRSNWPVLGDCQLKQVPHPRRQARLDQPDAPPVAAARTARPHPSPRPRPAEPLATGDEGDNLARDSHSLRTLHAATDADSTSPYRAETAIWFRWLGLAVTLRDRMPRSEATQAVFVGRDARPTKQDQQVTFSQVGRLGLEPRTHGLKVRCSTIELTPPAPTTEAAPSAPRDRAPRLQSVPTRALGRACGTWL